jgi:hypothetical protein
MCIVVEEKNFRIRLIITLNVIIDYIVSDFANPIGPIKIVRIKMYTTSLRIGTADPHRKLFASNVMTAGQHMPLVQDQCRAHQTYSAILRPCVKRILLSIASHISQAAIPLPICVFVTGPESNEHAELQSGQCKIK